MTQRRYEAGAERDSELSWKRRGSRDACPVSSRAAEGRLHCDRFKTSCEAGETGLLLIDSEDFVSVDSPWEHLAERAGDGFTKPQNAEDDHCHLMVVCMESWFLADKDALAIFFGQGFNKSALPGNEKVKEVSKHDIFEGLKRASSKCKIKAPYGKGEHSFRILQIISPEKVGEASPWAKRFFQKLDSFLKACS